MINGSTNKSFHLAIIPDGNRRAARRLMRTPWEGHNWGARKIEEIFDWCREFDIKKITIYAFSLKNFKSRPKEEFDYLMKLFKKEFIKLKEDKRIHQNKIKINFIGKLEMFPKDLQKVMKGLMLVTKPYKNYLVNFAMAYDGRAEIIDATKKIARKIKQGKLRVEEINEELFSEYLYLPEDVDLIIRTSGEKRTSSFLPWQADYAELEFVKEYFPDFKKESFAAAIEGFNKRERRFGK